MNRFLDLLLLLHPLEGVTMDQLRSFQAVELQQALDLLEHLNVRGLVGSEVEEAYESVERPMEIRVEGRWSTFLSVVWKIKILIMIKINRK